MLLPYTDGSIRPSPEHRNAHLLTQLSQLFPSRRPIGIGCHESRRLLLELQPPRELRRGGGFPRALQPNQQDHRRPDGCELRGAACCAPTLRARSSSDAPSIRASSPCTSF